MVELEAGNTIGSYRIVRCIGRGGMGTVYEVEHIDLGVRYALKTFTFDSRDDFGETLKTKFLEEGKLLARLKHQNLARVFDLAIEEGSGTPYFVMDLVTDEHGKPCSVEDLGLHVISEETVYGWFRELASALDYIHENGIVHRDVKPDNLLIDHDRHVVLTDFGVSRIFGMKIRREVDAADTMVMRSEHGRLVFGTEKYMAPEVAEGNEATPEADAYSLGVMVLRWLTGFYYGDNPGALSMLSGKKYRWLPVLARLLAPVPERRPKNYLPLVDQLQLDSSDRGQHGIKIRCSGCGRMISVPANIVDGQHVRCPHCNIKFEYSLRSMASIPGIGDEERTGGESLLVKCKRCGRRILVDDGIQDGQHVRCPYCEKKFSYKKSAPEKQRNADVRPKNRNRAMPAGKMAKKLVLARMKDRYDEKRRRREWKLTTISRVVWGCGSFLATLVAVVVYFIYQAGIDTRLTVRNTLAQYITVNSRILCDWHSQYSSSIRECRNVIWANRDDNSKLQQLRECVRRFQSVQSDIDGLNQTFSAIAPRLDSMSVDEIKLAQADLSMRMKDVGARKESVGFDIPTFKSVVKAATAAPSVRAARPVVRAPMPSECPVVRVPASVRNLNEDEVSRLMEKLRSLQYNFNPQDLKQYSVEDQKSILQEMLNDAIMLRQRHRNPN